MIVLGIDPSSTSAGYGLLECRQAWYRYLTCGCIRPRSSQTFEDRLVFLYDQLTGLIAKHAPDEAAMESTFFGRDAEAVAKLGQAKGVLLLALRKAGLPVAHYTPAEVKKAVVGRGQATKEQVQFMIAKLLGLKEPPWPLDASDALAVALCHVFRPEGQLPRSGRRRRPEVEALLSRMIRR